MSGQIWTLGIIFSSLRYCSASTWPPLHRTSSLLTTHHIGRHTDDDDQEQGPTNTERKDWNRDKTRRRRRRRRRNECPHGQLLVEYPIINFFSFLIFSKIFFCNFVLYIFLSPLLILFFLPWVQVDEQCTMQVTDDGGARWDTDTDRLKCMSSLLSPSPLPPPLYPLRVFTTLFYLSNFHSLLLFFLF